MACLTRLLAIIDGWHAPFIGTSHKALAYNLQDMYHTSIKPTKEFVDRRHMSHTSIIQSSGSGKSRLVDEIAKDIFTIPFNVREARDAACELSASLMR